MTAAGEPRGPLFCMPVAVKDNFDTYDMPATVGSLALIGNQPPRDAPFVERLRQAGAIIVGKTNMDEFAMGIRGLSGAGGRVGNAYDTAQSAGGSSSGSAVAVRRGFRAARGRQRQLRLAAHSGGLQRRGVAARHLRTLRHRRHLSDRLRQRRARRDHPRHATLRAARSRWRAIGWRADAAETGGLRGKRIGVLRRFDRKDPWSPAEPETQGLFRLAIALIQHAGAEIVEDVALDDFNARLGPEFLKGFARKVDAAFDAYPAARRNWRDVCQSGRIRPEWSARECMAAGASAAAAGAASGRRRSPPTSARSSPPWTGLGSTPLLYPVDGRGARAQRRFRPHHLLHRQRLGTAGGRLPGRARRARHAGRARAHGPTASRRSPGGDDGRVRSSRAGPCRARRTTPARAELAALDIARQNELRLRLGWSAFRSRRGKDLGALAPEKFRALTEEAVKAAVAGR